jgi:hypothetical protein
MGHTAEGLVYSVEMRVYGMWNLQQHHRLYKTWRGSYTEWQVYISSSSHLFKGKHISQISTCHYHVYFNFFSISCGSLVTFLFLNVLPTTFSLLPHFKKMEVGL